MTEFIVIAGGSLVITSVVYSLWGPWGVIGMVGIVLAPALVRAAKAYLSGLLGIK